MIKIDDLGVKNHPEFTTTITTYDSYIEFVRAVEFTLCDDAENTITLDYYDICKIKKLMEIEFDIEGE